MYTAARTSNNLSVEGLSYQIGTRKLLQDIDLTLVKGDRLTIVGENGVGKSTFLRILSGDIVDYDGQVKMPKTLGYLPQSFESFADAGVMEHIITTCQNPLWNEHFDLYDSEPYPLWMKEFNRLGGYEISRSLSQLGLKSSMFHQTLSELSGGEKIKIHLCAIMHQNPDILLLDEPTNHLDIQGIHWLESQLCAFSGSVVMITHDRALINNATTRISELSPTRHGFHHFTGGYETYLEQQEKLRERLLQKREAQEKELKHLSHRLHQKKQPTPTTRARSDNNKLGFNARGERKQKSSAREINDLKSKQHQLQDHLVHIPEGRKNIDINLGEKIEHDLSLTAVDLSFRMGQRSLFSDLNFSLQRGDRLCVTGCNGTGKTILLKILAGIITPDKGTIAFSDQARCGFLDQEQESIDLHQTPIDFVMHHNASVTHHEALEKLRKFGVVHQHDLDSPLMVLSIGTRRKVQLAGIVASQANILLLDEPTNHLDILSLEKIEEQLRTFPGIVIAVSHDRYFIDQLGAQAMHLGPLPKEK